ncbi:flagellar basal-body rod protein FlgF [Candidatus Nitrospira nitrificans]|uniref:Flagellar basal-body rod protein FlgF n=1 Tax=Candidatus Nitrospira nitrificans TaxID=1742973 RepID=A0A0S4L4G3_9BACT|nr:flagellar basal-body rod protein FlgF [Candidatus Nitrospira nitrificans]CUS31578.1 Flagellar basal-body rod protein FlgF [Candidatus Nitrospira nitrificans]
MNRGIYSVLSGALAHERRMQVFANNMANVNTAGFKQDEQAFKAIFPRYQAGVPTGSRTGGLAQQIMARPSGPSERAFVAPHQLKTTFEPGRIRLTGNPLDVAIQGRGFFEVQTPQGPRYTRNGMLSLDNQRRLVTGLGYPLMGTKGEIKIPPGKLDITAQGEIRVDDKAVATIKVMEFQDDNMPQKSSEGLFFSEKGTIDKNPQIQVGHIEESNVNSIGEMVKMLQGMRNYESTQKLIQTLDRMAEVAIQDVGRVL